MTKILFTIGCLNQGGAEQRLLELITNLKSSCYDFTFYVLSGKKGTLDEKFITQGAKIFYGKKNPISFYLYVKKNKFKVIHSNVALASGLYLTVAKLAGAPIRLAHIRTVGIYNKNNFFNKLKNSLFKKLIIKFSTKIIGVCTEATAFAPMHLRETIYNGIKNNSSLTELPREKNSIVCLGRMHNAKNLTFSIDVLNSLNINEDWNIYFFGDENKIIKDEIRNKASELRLENKIHFCGHTNEPQKVLSQFSVLLLPSVREGLPGVVLEALSVGTPVVASSLPGCREIESKIDGIKTLDDWDSRSWANEIRLISKISDTACIINQFKNSPFDFDIYVAKITKLWN